MPHEFITTDHYHVDIRNVDGWTVGEIEELRIIVEMSTEPGADEEDWAIAGFTVAAHRVDENGRLEACEIECRSSKDHPFFKMICDRLEARWAREITEECARELAPEGWR